MSMMVSFVLSFFPRDVLDEILNLIESVSGDFPSYSLSKGWVKIKCHKCFNIKYGHHPRHISCTPLTTLLVMFYTRKE